MPIRIPDNLPARKTLEDEGVNVMDSSRAARQDIRPLEFGLLNLMPNKERTETQFARLIGATPLQINLSLVRVTEHQSKNTPEDYLNTFYQTWEEVKGRKFDGFIVTGAPVANLPFEEVRYWPEMLECAPHHVHLLGRAGRAAPFPWCKALPHGQEGLRRLPPSSD
jgi:homoserine O-succinyltransferase/O-acetyltransferase